MEVVAPLHPLDYNFDSACSSPYMTAPSSPRRSGGDFFSAPTTPRLASTFFRRVLPSSAAESSLEEPPAAKICRYNREDDEEEDEEFQFDFSGQLDRAYALSADELFDGGKIRPLGMNYTAELDNSQRGFEQFPEKMGKDRENRGVRENRGEQSQRGRSGKFIYSSSSSSTSYVRKGSRSLSPLRVSDFVLDRENRKPPSPSPSSSANSCSSVSSSMAAAAKGSKKWRLRDFLLFRSASEGRATGGKDPLKKFYAPLLSRKKSEEDLKTASFRSTESGGGSVSGSSRRRSGSGPGSVRSSAHELHYKANRAVSEEMRRKTFLPYKQDLLGCLGFNSVSSVHEMTRGLGSLTRG